MGYRGLAGRARHRRARDARAPVSWWQLWLGVAISAALFVPNLVWQWQHGWPFFEVILPHLDSQESFTRPFWLFEWRQAMSMNPLLAPLCVAGMLGPFVDRRLAAARFLSLGFVLTTAFYFLQRGTNYYLFPVYPTMFVVGSIFCQGLGVWVVRGWIAAAIAVSAFLAPIGSPSSHRRGFRITCKRPALGPHRSRPQASAHR
jgi:hypothetical protein